MSEADQESSGRVVAGRYRLETVLGRGGMGVVWRAVDTLIERRVALKELRAPVPGGDAAAFVERAMREARNAGRLNHPSVVAVHDVIAPATDDDAVYIVMEYVEAPTLAEVLDQQGPLRPSRVAAIGLGILDGLDVAHAMGIVHRDIKPGNVLIGDGDRVKLTDFGIALAAEDTRLTRSGVLGTQAYLAPECFEQGQAGPAADLWALGATLFHAVAGRAPFDRDTTTATLRAILFEDSPAPPCGPPLAEAITGLLTRPVDARLTSDGARQLLQPAAAAPADAPPAADTHPTPGQAAWEAQATGFHPRPPTEPPSPLAPATVQPSGPSSPYATTQPPNHGGPAGSPYPATGSGPPPQPARTAYGMPGPGQPRRNNKGWVVGAIAAAAVLLVVVILASGGGSDSDGSGPATAEENRDLAEESDASAREFIDAINRGDEDTALEMLCPHSPDEREITEMIEDNASLEIDESTIRTFEGSFNASLVGTVGGEPVDSGNFGVSGLGCVDSFFVST